MNDNSILKIEGEKMGKLENCKAIYQEGILIKKYLRMKPKTLVIIVMVVTIFTGILVPTYLTKDFPDRKDFKDTYPKVSLVEVEKKD